MLLEGPRNEGGTEEEMRRAFNLFMLDRAQGSAEACAMLGNMHWSGRGVAAVDLEGALAFFEEGLALGAPCEEEVARLKRFLKKGRGKVAKPGKAQ